MNVYFVKTPKIISSFYKNYYWKINTNKKEIYLTFDDGPTPKVTEFVLSTLKTHNVKATFFCISKNIKKHPKIFNKIIDEGHSIGNHTNNHLNGWKTNTKEYILNVKIAQEIITKQQKDNGCTLNNTKSKLFRPPYGKIKKSQANQLIRDGYKIIMWSVLSGDFDTSIDVEKCTTNVITNAKSGSIIVFHDSEKAFNKLKSVLSKVITHFLSLGFKFKAI